MTQEKEQPDRTPTRILQARYNSGAAFLRDIDPEQGKVGTVTYATKIPLDVDELVILEILFPELPNRVLLRGRVMTLESTGPTATIEIAEEDLETRDFLIQVATGEAPGPAVGRRYYRIPLEIPVDWQVLGSSDVTISSTDDVGAGGVQIRTQNPPQVGTEVEIILTLEEESQLRIRGRVAWVRADEVFSGMGVQFAEGSAEEKKKLRDLLRKAMERGAFA